MLARCLMNPMSGFPRRCSAIQSLARHEVDDLSFMTWLFNRNNDGDLSAVRIGTSEATGRGLFAVRPIRAGDCLLEISEDLIITPDDLSDELNEAFVEPWTKLAFFVVTERSKGQASDWFPYLAYLPSPSELNNTFVWSTEEMKFLEGSPLYRKTVERVSMIATEFESIEKEASQLVPSLSLEDFKHAYATVFSRTLAVGVQQPTLVMIPMLDFFNHDPTSSAKLSYNGILNAAVVRADRDYQEGDQVWISYGDLSNVELALDYGFTVPNNMCDEAEVCIDGTHYRLNRTQGRELNVSNDVLATTLSHQIGLHEASLMASQKDESLSASRKDVIKGILESELTVLLEWLERIR